MIEWANHWAKGIEYRKSDNQNVAGMFTHIGELNMVRELKFCTIFIRKFSFWQIIVFEMLDALQK